MPYSQRTRIWAGLIRGGRDGSRRETRNSDKKPKKHLMVLKQSFIMPALRRIQPPPVDNQIPVVTSEPGFSATMQVKEWISKRSLAKLRQALQLLFFLKLLLFIVIFIVFFFPLLAAQRRVELMAPLSFVPPLLTVLDCLRCVCSTRRRFIVRK